MTQLQSIFYNLPPVRIVRNRAKAFYIPGSDGMSLYDVSRFFFLEMRVNKLSDRCSAVTYNFLMAIPPTLLFLFSLVPYLPLRNVQDTILSTVRLVSPNQRAYENISALIIDFMNKEQTGLLSFGILLTFYFSSNGMMGLLRSFEKSTPIWVKRSGFRKRWVALKLTFMLICVALLSLAAFIIQTAAVNEILLMVFNNTVVVRLASLALIVFIVCTAISVIYTYGPSFNTRLNFFSPGSVMATILCVLTTVFFFFMVNNFLNYSKVYGSIGSIMAFMVWLWFNTLVILLGYELNVSILMAKNAKEKDVLETKSL